MGDFTTADGRHYAWEMARLQLPRTQGCLVCGSDNPVGLKLTSFVDNATGIVTADFIPHQHHIGFTGVVHGGALATVLDEIMVWCATWQGKRFCLAAELNIRYRSPGRVGSLLHIEGRIVTARSRLITTTGTIHAGGILICEASGKYMPLPDPENQAFVATLVTDPASAEAAGRLA